jgi:AcrR family transcriptional regulator
LKPEGARPAVRRGRPPNDQAGEVEERILEAARQVFLERGFEGASLDEIAGAARAGKPTIYARFPNKEALFTEVVTRWVRKNTDIHGPFDGRSVEERLQLIATTVLRRALAPESVQLIRAVLAEARRFPELSMNISRQIRAQGSAAFTRLIGELAETDELRRLPAFAPDRIATTARVFLDLVLLPLVLRALFGDAEASEDAEIEAHARQRVRLLLAASGQPADWWENG